MPSIYNSDSQPHPFWDFVASLDGTARPDQARSHVNHQQASSGAATGPSTTDNPNAAKQPTVEDDVIPASSSQAKETTNSAPQANQDESQLPLRSRRGCGRGGFARHACHRGHPQFCGRRSGPRGWFGPEQSRPCNPPDEVCAPQGNMFNTFGLFEPSFHGPSRHRGFPGPPHDHPRRQHARFNRCGREPPNNFNLSEFLTNLGSRIGIDLTGAAASLGRDIFPETRMGGLREGVDFEPRYDVFDTATAYMVHLSLPGAKKEDVGVDWDSESSSLRVAGVVYRPGVDEDIYKLLAVDGRKNEVGVFEKKICLDHTREPVQVDVTGIRAKMTDGVLVVKVPKVAIEHRKREVPISSASSSSSATSAPSSPTRYNKIQDHGSPTTEKKQVDQSISTPFSGKGKQPVYDQAQPAAHAELDNNSSSNNNNNIIDTRSQTEIGDDVMADDIGYDDPPEQLPQYQEHPSDTGDQGAQEPDSDEDVDYVRIDVG